MEEGDDADGGVKANGPEDLEGVQAHNYGRASHVEVDNGLEAPVGASQYGFFAADGSDGGLGEDLGGLEGGLEDGVEAPPEEELLVGGLEDDVNLLADYAPDTSTSLTSVPGGSTSNKEALTPDLNEDLDVTQKLKLLSNEPAPPQSSSASLPNSFLSDPVAVAPAKGGPPGANWPVGYGSLDTPGRRQDAISGFTASGSSAALPQHQSSIHPQQRKGPWNLSPGLIFKQSSSIQGTAGNQHSSRQPWQEQMGLQRQHAQTPGYQPQQTLTVEELEARIIGSAQPRQGGAQRPSGGQPPNYAHSSNYGQPGVGDQRANTYQMLSRSSTGSAFPPPPRQAYSLPSGISLSGGLVGVQQSLANAGLGQASQQQQIVNPQSPRGQHAMHYGPNLSRQSPVAGPNLARISPGGNARMSQQAGYGNMPGPPEQRSANTDYLMKQHQQQLARARPMGMPARPMYGRGFGPQFGPGFLRGLQQMPDQLGAAPVMRRRQGSKHMEAEEIESILRIQWKSLHGDHPYVEDYYYQAYVNKHTNGANQRDFAPDALRDLAPSEKLGAEPAMYVKLEGLGKIAYSNVRRPRPLMDLVAEPADKTEEEDPDSERPTVKPLEEEPLLAARIVIEDSMCLLLDVDDIDRVWTASGGMREDEHILRQRRSVLMDAFATSLRLPDGALRPAGPGRASDAVFVRLMGLHKGRVLLARAVKLLTSPIANPAGYAGPAGRRPPPLRIVWAALRNVRLLFSVTGASAVVTDNQVEKLAAQRMMEATSRLAASTVDVMRRLESPRAICDCMAALVQGDLASKGSVEANHADNLLPLTPIGEPVEVKIEWLAEIIAALLQRANELGLADWAAGSRASEGLAVPEGLAWRDCYAAFFELLARHLRTLSEVCRLAIEAGSLAAARYAKQIVPIALIRAALPHATAAQREQIRTILSTLA